MANPYTPEAAAQRYPGQATMNVQRQARTPWRASGASRPKPQQNAGGDQEAQPGTQKAPDMSMYSPPGQARPVQAQSQGTPYGTPGGMPSIPGFQSFAMPGYGTRQQADGSEQYTGQNDFGNFGNMPVNQRPLPFSAQYTNFDGTASSQPDFGRRDAFIQNINDAMLPYYVGQSQGAPQFDFQSMYQKAGDMVSNGWQNPFAMPQQPSLEQQLSQYAPQTQYQPPSGDPGWMYYNPSTGMATHQPPAAPQPTSMPADPYAQYRADDSGYIFPNPAGPQQPTFDPLYGRGTPEAWMAAGAPKSAPMLAGIFAKGYTPQPGETDVIQPTAARQGPQLPSEDRWRLFLGGSWAPGSEAARDDFRQRGVAAGYQY